MIETILLILGIYLIMGTITAISIGVYTAKKGRTIDLELFIQVLLFWPLGIIVLPIELWEDYKDYKIKFFDRFRK